MSLRAFRSRSQASSPQAPSPPTPGQVTSWRVIFFGNAPLVAFFLPIAYLVLPNQNDPAQSMAEARGRAATLKEAAKNETGGLVPVPTPARAAPAPASHPIEPTPELEVTTDEGCEPSASVSRSASVGSTESTAESFSEAIRTRLSLDEIRSAEGRDPVDAPSAAPAEAVQEGTSSATEAAPAKLKFDWSGTLLLALLFGCLLLGFNRAGNE